MTDFEKLFNDNRELVFKYLMRLTGDASLSEELAQETFFRAYMNLASLRSKEKASAWLCKIAQNTYFAWYNEHKKIDPIDETAYAAAADSPEEELIRKELSEKAVSCLQELEEPYRQVFMLSVFEGMPLREISAVFGKSESWARVTFYRAKQKLIERMR